MTKLSYEQACERKAFIIRCLGIILNSKNEEDLISKVTSFLTGEFNIADDIVQAELKPILQKSNK